VVSQMSSQRRNWAKVIGVSGQDCEGVAAKESVGPVMLGGGQHRVPIQCLTVSHGAFCGCLMGSC
jgi:hypothetical protein